MRIKELRIYGFGKLENVTMKNLKDIAVFYGENEAGKTTIMSFIQSILFGFSSGTESYKPKFHSKYGGLILVEFAEIGPVSIERVKGKAKGDVTVTLPNGTIGSDELLAKILKGLDNETFRAIYLYNIAQLQNVGKLTNDELNRLLLSTSTVGTDKLVTIERSLINSADNLFRRRGSKPVLNELLTDLESEYSKLNEAKEKNSTYFILLSEREEVRNRQLTIKTELRETEEQLAILTEWQKQIPHVRERTKIKEELEEIGEIQFPTNGEAELSQLYQLLAPLQAQIAGKEEQLKQLGDELKLLEPNETIINVESEILMSSESMSLYEKLKYDEKEIEITINNLEAEFETLKDKFNFKIDNEQLKNINTSLMVKEEITLIDRNLTEISVQIDSLTRRLHDSKTKLQLLSQEEDFLSEQLLDKKDREQLETKFLQGKSLRAKEAEYDEITARLTSSSKNKRTRQSESKDAKMSLYKLLLICLVFIAVAVVSYFYEQTLISLVSLLALVIILLFNRPHKIPTGNLYTDISYYEQRKQELGSEISEIKNINIGQIEERLNADKEINEQLKLTKVNLTSLSATVTDENLQLTKLQNDYENLYSKVRVIASEWKVNEEDAANNLLLIFTALGDLKQLMRQIERMTTNKVAVLNEYKSIENKILNLADLCSINKNQQLFQIMTELKRAREQELANKISYSEKLQAYNKLKNEIKTLSVEANELLNHEEKLYEHANVASKEQFYKLANELSRKQDLEQLLRQKNYVINDKLIEQTKSLFPELSINGQVEVSELTNKLSKLHDEEDELKTTLAKLNLEISQLEDGGTYTELLHRFKLKRDDLNESGKEWAKFALASKILKITMDKYKKEKLPKLLEKASKYLRIITNDEYERIIISDDSFHLERNDRVLFVPGELSQGTTEQVSVALRLALALTLKEQGVAMPLIIDDGFVNFDYERSKSMIKLLNEVSEEIQVLFFTCHNHFAGLFNDDSIIKLSNSNHKQLSELAYD